MYQRIKNRLDARLLLKEMKAKRKNIFVGERILELAGILDEAYGEERKSKDMGGYILYFPDTQTYKDNVEEIWKFYNIQPNLYEYRECIGERELCSIQWIEKLFLLSSDDSLVMIYPQEVKE